MKNLAVLLFVLMSLPAFAQVTEQDAINAYAKRAFAKYNESVSGAMHLQQSIEKFLSDPSEANLKIVRDTWTDARKPYSETEAYRFYGGPIDAENGPEGFINSWPLDEVYADSIVERADLFPQINDQVLRSANEKDGHKNISTGYHAIEFLLWGRDTFPDSPGRRLAADFDPAKSPLALRRAQYLRSAAAILVTDLQSVQKAWDPAVAGSYAQNFVKSGQHKSALTNIFTGIIKLSGAELSQERMFVALDTKSQEEEQSCFSDTTHFDILHNFLGIKNIMNDGLLALIKAKDKSVAAEIEENLEIAENAIRAIPTPFDQAILNEPSRRLVMDAISGLETLAESLRQGAVTLGAGVP